MGLFKNGGGGTSSVRREQGDRRRRCTSESSARDVAYRLVYIYTSVSLDICPSPWSRKLYAIAGLGKEERAVAAGNLLFERARGWLMAGGGEGWADLAVFLCCLARCIWA